MFTTQFSDYPEFQILGVSLAAAFPAARVATFTSIFLQAKKDIRYHHSRGKPSFQDLSEDNKLFHSVSISETSFLAGFFRVLIQQPKTSRIFQCGYFY
jgi:hypothetical protein